MQAYRAACHFGDTEEEVAAAMRIASSHVFNQLLMFMLQEVRGRLVHSWTVT